MGGLGFDGCPIHHQEIGGGHGFPDQWAGMVRLGVFWRRPPSLLGGAVQEGQRALPNEFDHASSQRIRF